MKFIFKDYSFEAGVAILNYEFENGLKFTEKLTFSHINKNYNKIILDKALQLVFLLAGTSYWKAFGDPNVQLPFEIDQTTANLLNKAYQEGLSQYAFENKLTRQDLAHFIATKSAKKTNASYVGTGILSLQSGGKDSLLTATLLQKSNIAFSPFFVASGPHRPAILDRLGELITVTREIDRTALQKAAENGALDGHIPITYIIQSIALAQAILLNKDTILVSIGNEGVEPHAFIDDLPVNHQWSKTWEAEQLFADYVHSNISKNIRVGSPLRQYSELKIAKLFAKHAWTDFGHQFSSCNVANYRQHADNSQLKWCGNCPKCANAYLLFAPFIAQNELDGLFNGQSLFTKPSLKHSFKGLLGVDDVMKPFECVGEVNELRSAYHLAQKNNYPSLPFFVPPADFDIDKLYPSQNWAIPLVKKL